jgi:hypothetical protein
VTREEEIVRSTVAALASTVTHVPPLRITEAANELNPSAPAGSRRRAARRWRTWGAPLAAAAIVITLAVVLVLVRNTPNGGGATPVAPANCALPGVIKSTHAIAAPSVDGGPPYYVEVVACTGTSTSRSALLVGDTFTGKVLATVAPPAGISFQSVSAASDDRTFAVFATPAGAGPKVAGWWYLLRLAPGTSSPARLTRIPVKPLADVAETALSGSGQELAVGVASDETGTPWLGVYSVATGRLLRSWSSHGAPPFRIEGWGTAFFSGAIGNPQSSALTWVQGDQAIMFWAVASGGAADLRRLDLAGDGSDIVKDSQAIWSTAHRECAGFAKVSADGKTVICPVIGQASGKANETVRWLAYSVTAPAAPAVRYQALVDAPGLSVSTLWVSASGAAMIVEWSASQPPHGALKVAGFGLVSHGKFTPLKPPPTSTGVVGGPPGTAW